MTKYIEREAAIKMAKPYWQTDEDGFGVEWLFNKEPIILKKDVEAIPAADVVPVRYGCWNADKEDVEWGNHLIRYRCSVCNERPHFDKEEYKFILSPYCPNCGAKMDGDGE